MMHVQMTDARGRSYEAICPSHLLEQFVQEIEHQGHKVVDGRVQAMLRREEDLAEMRQLLPKLRDLAEDVEIDFPKGSG